jgi:hypothetical protein
VSLLILDVFLVSSFIYLFYPVLLAYLAVIFPFVSSILSSWCYVRLSGHHLAALVRQQTSIMVDIRC